MDLGYNGKVVMVTGGGTGIERPLRKSLRARAPHPIYPAAVRKNSPAKEEAPQRGLPDSLCAGYPGHPRCREMRQRHRAAHGRIDVWSTTPLWRRQDDGRRHRRGLGHQHKYNMKALFYVTRASRGR